MKFTKVFNTRVVVILLILALLLGMLASVLVSCAEMLIYPREYRDLVNKYAEKYAVPKELIYAVIKAESNFKCDAESHAGALGLMQMLPSTCEWLAKSHFYEDPSSLSLYDPETNIKYGTYYLQYLFSRFGSWEKAIIAYNWGEGNLTSFLESNNYIEGKYRSIPVKETRNYVSKVTRYWEKYNKLYK